MSPPDERGDEVFEVASTIFSEDLERASQNYFFAAGARDLFAATIEAMTRDGVRHTNADLRAQLEASNLDLWNLLQEHPDLAGSARYLSGTGNTADSIRAFLQQTVTARSPVRSASRVSSPSDDSCASEEPARCSSSTTSPWAAGFCRYRVLLDMAIKEALGMGRSGARETSTS